MKSLIRLDDRRDDDHFDARAGLLEITRRHIDRALCEIDDAIKRGLPLDDPQRQLEILEEFEALFAKNFGFERSHADA